MELEPSTAGEIVVTHPEASYLDEIECDFGAGSPVLVKRVVGGPRRPTVRLNVRLSGAQLDEWLDAREDEGWELREDQGEIHAVATSDNLDVSALPDAEVCFEADALERVSLLLHQATAYETIEHDAWVDDAPQRAMFYASLFSLVDDPSIVDLAREAASSEPVDLDALLAAAKGGSVELARRAAQVAREKGRVAYIPRAAMWLPSPEAVDALNEAIESAGSRDALHLAYACVALPDDVQGDHVRQLAWSARDRLDGVARTTFVALLAPKLGAAAIEEALDAVAQRDPMMGYEAVHALAGCVPESRVDEYLEIFEPFSVVAHAQPKLARRLAELGRIEAATAIAATTKRTARLQAFLGVARFCPAMVDEALEAVERAEPLERPSGVAARDLQAIASPAVLDAFVLEHPTVDSLFDVLESTPERRATWARAALAHARKANDELRLFRIAALAEYLEHDEALRLRHRLITYLARPYPGFGRSSLLEYRYEPVHDLRSLNPLFARVGGTDVLVELAHEVAWLAQHPSASV